MAENPELLPDAIEKKLVSALLAMLNITNGEVVKVDAYDIDAVSGSGMVGIHITGYEQVTSGLPDWFIAVSVIGATLVEADADKAIIRAVFGEVLNSVRSITPAALTDAIDVAGAGVAGIFSVTDAAIRRETNHFIFTVNFKLAVTGLAF